MCYTKSQCKNWRTAEKVQPDSAGTAYKLLKWHITLHFLEHWNKVVRSVNRLNPCPPWGLSAAIHCHQHLRFAIRKLMSQTKKSWIVLLSCLPSLPAHMDMQIESQVTRVVYPGQDHCKNWLTARSIFFYLLLASSAVLKQGFFEKLRPSVFVSMLNDNRRTWERKPARLHGKDRSAGVGTRSLCVPRIHSSVWLMVFCTGSSSRGSHIARHTSKWALHITYKNQSFSHKLLT